MSDDSTTTNTVPIEVQNGHCFCGCGESVSGLAYYRPGHDARHVSRMVREYLADEISAADFEQYLHELPSTALQDKARKAFARTADRIEKKAQAVGALGVSEGEFTEGEVQVGRWTYPARTFEGGRVVRNSHRDGSGRWMEVPR